MRILIAYDGSRGADAALLDLQRAGLPQEAEALVISVADVWTFPETSDASSESCAKNPDVIGLKKSTAKSGSGHRSSPGNGNTSKQGH
jgi:hypothetical protein